MHFYRNGNYTVCIENDGTKTRRCDSDRFKPSFPECIDITITQKCSIGCPYCFANCTPEGKHADIMSYKFIDTLHYYTEVAFNGNDLDHPQLEEFLYKLKHERRVFANMTVNQIQFMENLDKIKELVNDKLIYGVGVSYIFNDPGFIHEFKKLDNGVLHVINGIVTTEDLSSIGNLGLKLLILGYKDVGRGVTYNTRKHDIVADKQEQLKKELPGIIKEGLFKSVSFDNLALKQLDVRSILTEEEWDSFYMGDDGDFTFYIDLVNGTFSKSSSDTRVKHQIGDLTIDEMFNIITKE
jgi:MoaA/NifB/PqqE/SkfB family radical SAM enzyme